MTKIKDLVIIITFLSTLILLLIINLIIPDKDISVYERRKLKNSKDININDLLNGNSKIIEEYLTDQFAFRDDFRKLKNDFELDILRKKDINNSFIYDNGIFKLDYVLDEKSVLNVTDKINYIKDNYLDKNNIYYTIIPDKNYYLPDSFLKLDYKRMEQIMSDNLDINYINIFDKLNIDDYYKTDLHFKASNLLDLKEYISKKMNHVTNDTDYYLKSVGKFNGAYYGNILKNVVSDDINYLTNNFLDNIKSYDYIKDEYHAIYDLDKLSNTDKYNVFLSGPVPIIGINNDALHDGSKLIIFRDSFASSIAPLFVSDYQDIILIDLRYINTKLINEYVDFINSDVLFMYSTTILNNSYSIK